MHAVIWKVRLMIKVTSVSLDEDVAKELDNMSTRLGVSKSMAITMLIMKEAENPTTKEDRRRLLGPIIDSRAERRIERNNKLAKKKDNIGDNIEANNVSYGTSNEKDTKITNEQAKNVEPAEQIEVSAPTSPSRVIQKLNIMDDKDSIERSDEGMI